MMNRYRRLLLIIPVVFFSTSLFSQSAKLSAGKEPVWVVKNNIDYTKTSLDKDASEGAIDLCVESQVSLAEHTKYVRLSKKIISQAGVQNESTITVSFDPSYEKLTFHKISIIRNGETLNKLNLSKIKTIHQEEELNSFIYNGIIDAVLILEDVRAGDIVEYSYSVKGVNPVFNDKFSYEFNTEYSVPVYDLFYRLLVPKSREIKIKNTNETLQPVITNINDQQVYEWHKTNVAPLVLQDNLPSWYNPFGRVSLSEFKDWKEVNEWAMELFPPKKIFSAAIQKKIDEIEKGYNSDVARTAAALRFIQDDIRYMGIEVGRHTHKPADPSKVFAQRFGDCKEKSYLLCCMLNAMNIEASPVLINTSAKNNLNNMLPAPTNFDHTTVRVKLDGSYYWYDPTISFQRGNIKDMFYPDYQAGLVISPNTTSLAAIPFRNNSYQHINDYFKADDMFGGGSLVVTTTFKGDEADEARNHFNNESVSEILNADKKFYSKYYDDIKADSLVFTDDDSTGIFTTIEHYTIPKFWTITKDDVTKADVKKFTFSAFAINSVLHRPKDKDRKMPIGLSFPASYKEEIIISLPDEWSISTSETHLTNKGFAYNSKFTCVYNQVRLTTDYENFKDFVASDESAEYFKNINQYDDNENYTLSSGGDGAVKKPFSSSGKDTLPAIISIVVIGGFLVWRYRRR
jgi:transglutaminase-like putative cysteine protease